VGLALPAMRGEEDRELSFEGRSATGLAQWCGIERGCGGTEGGGIDGAASREAAAHRAGNMARPTAQTKISP
jgi:hypothetical protein